MDRHKFPFSPNEPVAFEWDEANREKCREHGVSVDEIEGLFATVGRSAQGRGMLVVFTVRVREAGKFIRPVSARYMHRRELAYYEKTAQEITGTEDR
jgi:uncharacterized protein